MQLLSRGDHHFSVNMQLLDQLGGIEMMEVLKFATRRLQAVDEESRGDALSRRSLLDLLRIAPNLTGWNEIPLLSFSALAALTHATSVFMLRISDNSE
jgi:hypothetical protein